MADVHDVESTGPARMVFPGGHRAAFGQPQTPDCELIEAAIGGCGDSMGVIFDRHHGAITNWLARRVGLDLACDLCSDVFTWAIANLDRYDPARGSVGAWLHTQARAALSRHLRRGLTWSTIARKLPGQDRTAFAEPNEPGPASEALLKLPHPLRVSVWLRVCGDLSYEEIAERLDIAEPAARKRVSRGLALMKTTLDATQSPDTPSLPADIPADEDRPIPTPTEEHPVPAPTEDYPAPTVPVGALSPLPSTVA